MSFLKRLPCKKRDGKILPKYFQIMIFIVTFYCKCCRNLPGRIWFWNNGVTNISLPFFPRQTFNPTNSVFYHKRLILTCRIHFWLKKITLLLQLLAASVIKHGLGFVLQTSYLIHLYVLLDNATTQTTAMFCLISKRRKRKQYLSSISHTTVVP